MFPCGSLVIRRPSRAVLRRIAVRLYASPVAFVLAFPSFYVRVPARGGGSVSRPGFRVRS